MSGVYLCRCVLCACDLEYERIRVIYRVNQAEYGIRILVVAPQEYANIYLTRRPTAHAP